MRFIYQLDILRCIFFCESFDVSYFYLNVSKHGVLNLVRHACVLTDTKNTSDPQLLLFFGLFSYFYLLSQSPSKNFMVSVSLIRKKFYGHPPRSYDSVTDLIFCPVAMQSVISKLLLAMEEMST